MVFSTTHNLTLSLLLLNANVSDDRQWSSLPFRLPRIRYIFPASIPLDHQARCHPDCPNSHHCNKIQCNHRIPPNSFNKVLEVPECLHHFTKLAFCLCSNSIR